LNDAREGRRHFPPIHQRHLRRTCWATFLTAALASAAFAQPAQLSPEQRATLERLAVARARADLLTHVLALPIEDQQTMRAWAAESVARDRALRLWVRSLPATGAVRFYTDQSCEADVALSPDTLAAQVLKLRDEFPPAADERVPRRTLTEAERKWPLLWGTGSAAVDELTDGVHKPDGWEDVSQEGIAVTRRAAEADARHALLDAAGRLPVTNARRLEDFLDAGVSIRRAVLERLAREATVNVTFAPDQVAVGEARIGIIPLIRILTDVHRENYQGELFHAADFREMALHVATEEVSAEGLAVPPSHLLLRSRYRPIELDAPEWATSTRRTTGHYEPPDEGEELKGNARIEAARLDGMDRLREEIMPLEIRAGVTIESFLAYHEELKDDVIVFLSGTRIAGAPREKPGDIVEVPVELPLQRLWWIIRRGMKAIEVDRPTDANESQERGQP